MCMHASVLAIIQAHMHMYLDLYVCTHAHVSMCAYVMLASTNKNARKYGLVCNLYSYLFQVEPTVAAAVVRFVISGLEKCQE